MHGPRPKDVYNELVEKEKEMRRQREELWREKAKLRDMQLFAGRAAVHENYNRIYRAHDGSESVVEELEMQTLAISQAGRSEWDTVAARAKLSVVPFGSDLGARSGFIRRFRWGDGTEASQAERYLPYLKGLIGTQNRSFELLNGNTDCPFIAGTFADELGYKIHGNPEAVLVLRVAAILQPQAGLRVVIKIKREVEDRNLFQAMVLLVIANHYATSLKPFVVLTDLHDKYWFFWMDDHTVNVYRAPSAAFAWGFFDAILGSESYSNGKRCVELRDDIDDPPAPAKRRRLEVEAAQAGDSDVANLADLEDFIAPKRFASGS